MRTFQDATTLLSGATTTITGKVVNVADFRNLVLALSTSGSANFTLKAQGSISTICPDFTASQSPTNMWTYMQLIDLNDQSTITGATGVTSAGTDVNRSFEVNINLLRWFTVTITAISAGAITAQVMPSNDNE